MGSHAVSPARKQHVVCVPYPAQGHINPMMKVAKLLHAKGFYVTFVNTIYNHNRLLRSRGSNALDGLPSFQFESIPDGLPETDVDVTQDIPSLCESTPKNSLAPFKELLRRINAQDEVPRVSCIVSDGCMSFTLDAAEELGVPEVLFVSVCEDQAQDGAQTEVKLTKPKVETQRSSPSTKAVKSTEKQWQLDNRFDPLRSLAEGQ